MDEIRPLNYCKLIVAAQLSVNYANIEVRHLCTRLVRVYVRWDYEEHIACDSCSVERGKDAVVNANEELLHHKNAIFFPDVSCLHDYHLYERVIRYKQTRCIQSTREVYNRGWVSPRLRWDTWVLFDVCRYKQFRRRVPTLNNNVKSTEDLGRSRRLPRGFWLPPFDAYVFCRDSTVFIARQFNFAWSF